MLSRNEYILQEVPLIDDVHFIVSRKRRTDHIDYFSKYSNIKIWKSKMLKDTN